MKNLLIKLSVLKTLLFAKKFMLITGKNDIKHIISTYDEKEISRSGKAIYFN